MLLEWHLLLFLAGVLLMLGYQGYLTFLASNNKVMTDLEFFRVKRAVFNLLEQELSFKSATVQLEQNNMGTILTCREVWPQRTLTYYCQNASSKPYYETLYLKTQISGQRPGINPLTPSSVIVTEWQLESLDNNKLHVKLTLTDVKGKRKKEFSEVIILCNGKII